MKRKLTPAQWWAKFCGRKYMVNHASKEIHRLDHLHVNCLPMARRNRQFITEARAFVLIAEKEYNGCRWCWKEFDAG